MASAAIGSNRRRLRRTRKLNTGIMSRSGIQVIHFCQHLHYLLSVRYVIKASLFFLNARINSKEISLFCRFLFSFNSKEIL